MTTVIIILIVLAASVLVGRWLLTSSPWAESLDGVRQSVRDRLHARRSTQSPPSPSVLERRVMRRVREALLRQSFFGRAPSTLAIRLHPDDLARLSPFLSDVEHDLQAQMTKLVQRHELRLDGGPPRVVFVPDEDRPVGSPDAVFSYDHQTVVDPVVTDDIGSRTRSGALLRILAPQREDVLLTPDRATTLGRTGACDVQIPHERVSRAHCEISRASGQWTIADLGSKNGTYVDERRINRPTALHDGARVRLGRSAELEFRTDASPAPDATVPLADAAFDTRDR